MQIRDLMKNQPVVIDINATVARAAEIFSVSGVSELMVVDDKNNFVGVLSEYDLIQPLLPNLKNITELGGTLEDALDFFHSKGNSFGHCTIPPLVNTDPIIVNPLDEVFYAATILKQYKIRCLPVIEGVDLAGCFCMTDVCKVITYPALKSLAAANI